ncbi:hypothetical protein [Kitasatospora sp. McL0602]|uniref:hypothetical protein n=1 Tax=Kitasatospora sp. McL0602 TaxID=3439530 RepID=UPI003F8B74B1
MAENQPTTTAPTTPQAPVQAPAVVAPVEQTLSGGDSQSIIDMLTHVANENPEDAEGSRTPAAPVAPVSAPAASRPGTGPHEPTGLTTSLP